jgi:hypothetical protein
MLTNPSPPSQQRRLQSPLSASIPPPLGMAIDNLGRVRPKLSPDDAKSLDAASEKLVQIKQAAR